MTEAGLGLPNGLGLLPGSSSDSEADTSLDHSWGFIPPGGASATDLLVSLGLSQLTAQFDEEEIDCDALLIMTDHDLKELGIGKGPRMKLCRWIAEQKQQSVPQSSPATTNPPIHLTCPISHKLFVEAVMACDGHTYSKASIEHWFQSGNSSSPLTHETLTDHRLIANHAMRQHINDFLNPSR